MSFDGDEPRVVQDLHVMGDRRLAEFEPRNDIAGTDRIALGGNQPENAETGGITERFELRYQRVLRGCRQRQRDDRIRTTLGWPLSSWHEDDDTRYIDGYLYQIGFGVWFSFPYFGTSSRLGSCCGVTVAMMKVANLTDIPRAHS